MGLRDWWDDRRAWWDEKTGNEIEPLPGDEPEPPKQEVAVVRRPPVGRRRLSQSELRQYWYEHPIGFQCDVLIREPRERSAHVGGYGSMGGGLGVFGSVPVPFHGSFMDQGRFQVREDSFVFIGLHCTRIIPFGSVMHTTWFDNGDVHLNYQGGGGVISIEGPVKWPVTGALVSVGRLDPAILT